MANNNTIGSDMLASEIQKQVLKIMRVRSGIVAERGEIVKGKRLKLYSIPDSVLDKSDYSVCVTIQDTRPLKVGDMVLVIWTNDGEPVVIDKIIDA